MGAFAGGVSAKSGVFKSIDGGSTWRGCRSARQGGLTIDPQYSQTLYTGTPTDRVRKAVAGATGLR